MANINQESARSLFVEPTARGNALSSATGFVVEDAGRAFLVTNWHVLSGLDSRTGETLSRRTGAVPDAITISHNARSGLGRVVDVVEPLYDPVDPDDPDASDRVPRWSSHPDGGEVDVAVLPLTDLDQVRLMPYQLPQQDGPEVYVDVTSDVAVVGFPFGLTHAAKFGVWTRGTVATEFEVDYDGRPCFLIDARTRQGQSGSPVIYFSTNARAVRFRDSDTFLRDEGSYSQLLGLYSGRLNETSDLGYVWRPRVIAETIAVAQSQ